MRVAARLVGLMLAAWPLAAAQAGERIANDVLGFSVERPDGWRVLSAEANAASLNRLEIGDAEARAAILANASTPVVAFVRDGAGVGLRPSFKINARPYGAFGGMGGTAILSATLATMREVLPDLTVLSEPGETSVGGAPAGHARVAYSLKAGGREEPAVTEMWVVPRADHFLVIGVSAPAASARTSAPEGAAIVRSIRFDPR